MNQTGMEIETGEVYIEILVIAYPLFFFITTALHLLFIYIILFHSPSYIHSFRLLLLKTSVLDVSAIVMLFYLQPRIASGIHPHLVPLYCYGPCRYSNPNICYKIYMLWQIVSLAVVISVNYTMYFKYHKIKATISKDNFRLLFFYFLFYLPVFASTICSISIIFRNMGLYNENLVPGRNFIQMGAMTLNELPNRINFIMIVVGIYLAPVIAIWLWRASNKKLREVVSSASQKTKNLTRNLMTGLAIQVVAHVVCYVPLHMISSYSLATGSQFVFQQFFLALCCNLTATIDPIIHFYYVVPYRRKILSLFGKKVNVLAVVSISKVEKA